MTSVKKVKVALLALVAALVIAIPTSAFAAQTLTIKSDTTGDEYTAYQVLKGNYVDGKLTNIDWAPGVDSTAIINEFKEQDSGFATFAEGKAVGATDVASYLSNNAAEDDAVARAFATAAAQGISNATVKAEFTEGDKEEGEEGKYPYTAAVEDDGYYVVVQSKAGKTSDAQDGAYSRFILGVIGEGATIAKNSKADIPTVEKKVLEDREDADWGDTGDFDFTQKIPYKITGTLPSVYADYDWYYYCFTDQMSPGLTLDESSIKVYKNEIKEGNEITGWTPDVSKVDTKSTLAQHDGKKDTVLKVEFEDLKVTNSDLAYGDKIIVYYECTYNADAVIGEPGNPNDVKLTYSNNPNKDGDGDTGDTPEDRNIVFTYQLDNLKIGEGNDAQFLAGAKFVLLNADKTKVAKVTDGKFAGFEDIKMTDGKPDYAGYEMTSGSDGKFYIAGIDEGEYVLHETFAPGDYTPSEDLTLIISAETKINDQNEGEIITLTLKINDEDPKNGDTVDGSFTGHVSQTITNIVATNLPSTGGIGTTIFYIVGIGLILAAAITLVVRRRNSTTA